MSFVKRGDSLPILTVKETREELENELKKSAKDSKKQIKQEKDEPSN